MSSNRLVTVTTLGLLAGGLLGLEGCALVRGGPATPVSSPARADVEPRSGLEVIGAMRRAHPSRDLRSIAFTVSSVDYTAVAAARTASARAFAKLPGKFRLATLPASRRSGFVRDQQRIAVFERGRRVASQSRVDLGLLLAYDVFAQGIDSTIRWLDVAGVRLGVARKDRFEGRPVWVVGAFAGDTNSTQFWVDADRWHVVRVIQRDPRAPNRIVDMRYSAFARQLDVPLPTRVDVYHAGRLLRSEVISNVTTNPTVPARAFDLSRWREIAAN